MKTHTIKSNGVVKNCSHLIWSIHRHHVLGGRKKSAARNRGLCVVADGAEGIQQDDLRVPKRKRSIRTDLGCLTMRGAAHA